MKPNVWKRATSVDADNEGPLDAGEIRRRAQRDRRFQGSTRAVSAIAPKFDVMVRNLVLHAHRSKAALTFPIPLLKKRYYGLVLGSASCHWCQPWHALGHHCRPCVFWQMQTSACSAFADEHFAQSPAFDPCSSFAAGVLRICTSTVSLSLNLHMSAVNKHWNQLVFTHTLTEFMSVHLPRVSVGVVPFSAF